MCLCLCLCECIWMFISVPRWDQIKFYVIVNHSIYFLSYCLSGRAYRHHRFHQILSSRLYWRRVALITRLQATSRMFLARLKYSRSQKKKLLQRTIVENAATLIQSRVRGFLCRSEAVKSHLRLVEVRILKCVTKAALLEKLRMNTFSRIVRRMFRANMPLRYLFGEIDG